MLTFAGRRLDARVGALAATLLLAPLVMAPGLHDAANLPQSAFIQVALLVVLTCWPSLGARGSAPDWRTPLAGLTLLGAASLTWAHNPGEGYRVWRHMAICALGALVTFSVVRERTQVRLLLAAAALAGVLISLLGLGQAWFSLDFLPQASRPAATFVNKNVAAQFVVGTLPLGLVFAYRRRTGVGWAVATILVQAVFLAVSFARAAWLALAAQAFLGAFLALRAARRPVRRVALAGAGVVLLVALALSTLRPGPARVWHHVSAPLVWLWSGGTPDPSDGSVVSASVRLAIWRNTWAMFQERPLLGFGLGQHKLHYPAYASRVAPDAAHRVGSRLRHVHNDYLQLATELGLAGLLLTLWLVAVAGRGATDLLRTAPRPVRPLAAAVSLSAVGLLVNAAFSFPFQRALPPLLLAMELGCLAALRRSVASGDAEPGSQPPGETVRRRLWQVVAALALLIVTDQHIRSLAADRHVRIMLDAQRRGEWPAAMEAARAVQRLDPKRPESLFVLGAGQLLAGDAAAAAPHLRAALDANPNDVRTLGLLVRAERAAGDGERALADATRLLRLTPHDPTALFTLGRQFDAQGRPGEALEFYRRAVKEDPDTPRLRYALGIAALRSGSHAEARGALERVLARNPDHAPAHKALGVLLSQVLGEREAGLVHLRQALELDPHIKDAAHIRRLLEAADQAPPARGS